MELMGRLPAHQGPDNVGGGAEIVGVDDFAERAGGQRVTRPPRHG